jgi:hypothetical protein
MIIELRVVGTKCGMPKKKGRYSVNSVKTNGVTCAALHHRYLSPLFLQFKIISLDDIFFEPEDRTISCYGEDKFPLFTLFHISH